MEIRIPKSDIAQAKAQGMDEYVMLFHDRIMDAIGGQLTPENMPQLNADQVTLLAYVVFRDEVMDGGFIQLIHNGYGPFIFLNPFAKAMGEWGARDFKKLVYEGRHLFAKHGEEICRECSDEEFMALFEQFPKFDDLDDAFVEMEEDVTALVAQYIENHLENFARVVAEGEEGC
ncbi:MAG: DMP19 family protein [Bacteroidaceae bacterium]|nr:DMP19 family protein [Bacteroidaceae bacterium]